MVKCSAICRLIVFILSLLPLSIFADGILFAIDSDRPQIFEGYEKRAPKLKISLEKVHSAILPHHLLAGAELWGFFQAVSEVNSNIKHITIIGPDHYRAEEGSVILANLPWKTPFGEVSPDLVAIQRLLKNKSDVRLNNKIHYREHSIASLVPFVKRFFPSAKITAVLIKPWLKKTEIENLGSVISTFSENGLVLLSTDFVHYKMLDETEKLDQKNESIIKSNFKGTNMNETLKVNNDCRVGTALLFDFNKKVKLTKSEKILYTNSHKLTGIDAPGTSYFFWVFGK